MRSWIQGVSFSLSLVVHAPVLAQPANARRMADEQFYRGRELATKGDCKRALGYFRTSHSLEPNRGKLINIALCEEQLGQIVSALRHFQEVLPQFPGDDERQQIARQHVEALTNQVSHIRVLLAPSASEGTVVRLDQVAIAASAMGTMITIDPGDHVLTVTAPGTVDRHYKVHIEPAKHATVSVSTGLGSQPESGPSAPGGGAPTTARRIAGMALAGGGISGIGVGVAVGLGALGKHTALKAACPSHAGCNQRIVDEASTGRALAVGSTVALVTGLAGLGAGTFLVVWDDRKKAATAFGLTPTFGGGALVLEGSF